MSKKNRGLKVDRSRASGTIPTPPAIVERLSFSFEEFDLESPKFFGRHRNKAPDGYLYDLLARLRDVCQIPFREFLAPIGNPKSLRSHGIAFVDTSERDGFKHLIHGRWKHQPWQFQVAKTKGRLVGYLVESKFHVVWLDIDHELYPERT